MYRVGVFGGTFDPPHLGHLAVAKSCLAAALVDEVWFILAVDPWQKADQTITPYELRLEMVQSLIEGTDKVSVCEIELELGKSVTFTTLNELSNRHKQNKFIPIIGADLLASLPTWLESKELITKYDFIVATRPGHDTSNTENIEAHVLETPGLHISSTDLRSRLREGESIDCLTTDSVRKVIEDNNLFST